MCDFKSSYGLSQTWLMNDLSVTNIDELIYTEIINEIKSIHKLIILVRSFCDNEQ
jgi:hypothetical protein